MANAILARRRMIGVALGPRTMAEAVGGLARAAGAADVVELRLDAFEEPYDLARLLRGRPCPVVATLRPVDQGGRCAEPAAARLRVLLRAAELGAELVDLEWDAATPAAVAALRAAGAGVLVSRHDFRAMPPELADGWWSELAAGGADAVKVVGWARDARDCLPVFRALRRADRPTVAIAMGEAGLPTRVLALREAQCLLTYAALEEGAGTAPGQLDVAELRGVYRADRVGPGTRVFGLLGPRVDSELAARYNGWLGAAGLDAVAVPFVASAEGGAVVAAFRELPVDGWHVHGAALQASVAAALDALGSTARQGRVNAVVARGDHLLGGWVESPEEQLALWTGRSAP